jgi:hypothetical protein
LLGHLHRGRAATGVARVHRAVHGEHLTNLRRQLGMDSQFGVSRSSVHSPGLGGTRPLRRLVGHPERHAPAYQPPAISVARV